MLAGPFASDSARLRFEREVELAARLQHSNIVRVLESGEFPTGQRYYAMEYVEGVPLDEYVTTAQNDRRATLQLFADLCEAVDHAHQHGVVHRDLKPDNVLIDEEGGPHILDFGLAKATDEANTREALTACVSTPGQVLGSLYYLSPEQAAGLPDKVDGRADVYALGVMLFKALTGTMPFCTEGRPSQVIQRILESAPIRPSTLSDQAGGEVETIILKALEKDRARRYQTAREMGDDIRRYLEGEPIRARRPSGFYFVRKKLAKHRVRVAGALAIVILGVLGLLTGIRWRQHDLAQARQHALQYQQHLEDRFADPSSRDVQAFYARHRKLAEAGLVSAHALRREQTPAAAIGFLERELQQDPGRWAYRMLLTELYLEMGRTNRAEDAEQAASQQAPDTADAWYVRSFATLKPAHALHCAEQAVRRQPGHALAWERLTRLRLLTGDLAGTRQGAGRLIELGEDPQQWTLFQGQVLLRQGKHAEAIERFTRVHAYLNRANAYRRIKEHAKAVEDYDRVLQRQGETRANLWVYYQRATPLWILGRTDEALDDYRRFRTWWGRPFYSDARAFLILHEQGRPRAAQELLDVALQEVTEDWLRQIFRCLAGDQTPEELVSAANRHDAEQLCEACYYAGETCLRSGRRAEARKWFQQCVETGIEFDPDIDPQTPMNEFELAQWRLDSLPAEQPPAQP